MDFLKSEKGIEIVKFGWDYSGITFGIRECRIPEFRTLQRHIPTQFIVFTDVLSLNRVNFMYLKMFGPNSP